jgi:DNA-binding NarL/FixJ family response regulator
MKTPQLRCVFVTLSPLFSVIIADTLSRRVEVRLLAEFAERDGLAGHLTALAPDLVVIGLGPAESDEIGASLLAEVPQARVLLISDDGEFAYLHEMRPYRSVLFDFSPDSLLTAIVARAGAAEG